MTGLPDLPAVLAVMRELAVQAGHAILDLGVGHMDADNKDDGTPVSIADRTADRIITQGLVRTFPDIPCISEEMTGLPPKMTGPFFLVDPLDGTRDFLRGSSDYTVNIALIIEHRPVLGVVAAPAHDRVFHGHVGTFCEESTLSGQNRRALRVCQTGTQPVILTSVTHPDPDTTHFLTTQTDAIIHKRGSSLKFCLIAAGEAHLYPRFSSIMAWDIAAGDAVLTAAGGHMRTLSNEAMTYGRTGWRQPGFMASAYMEATDVDSPVTGNSSQQSP